MKTCYSSDGCEFHHTDTGSLFDEMVSDGRFELGATYWEADYEPVTSKDFDYRTGELLDDLDGELFELVGERADNDFARASEEAKEELTDLLRGWIDRHIDLERYWKIVGTSREFQVTAQDVKDAE